MKELDPQEFEAELKRLRLATPGEETVHKLLAELSSGPPQAHVSGRTEVPARSWARLLRWLIPASAGATVCVILYWHRPAPPQPHLTQIATLPRPSLKADKVEIDRQLVADYDAVAKLPSGEPVRFRCEQWMDKIRWRDSAKGLVIEQTTPRLEIVPIRFETY